MGTYVENTLFINTGQGEKLIGRMRGNPFGTQVTSVEYDLFSQNPDEFLGSGGHVVVGGSLTQIKAVLDICRNRKASVGIIPLPDQKDLIRCYDLPGNLDAAVELALRQDAPFIDLIYCNGEIVLFKARVGRVPLLDAPVKGNMIRTIFRSAKRLLGLRLLEFEFTVSGNRQIVTAASGCMIIQHHTGTMASRLISHDSSLTDGLISLVISSPISISDYLRLLFRIIFARPVKKGVDKTVGLIKSPRIGIRCHNGLDVVIDGETRVTPPIQAMAEKKAVRINIGQRLADQSAASNTPAQVQFITGNLPLGKEVVRAKKRRIPIFPYASEERFKDLFSALKQDARINSTYLTLMVISTLLASVGLYLNSGSVIIGAMLIAPLMAPIVSLAMGLLRGDFVLINRSILKIILGIGLALASSTLLAALLPYDPITREMEARLNPSLLDLSVAILAGIAGAYTKSFKEIIQNLAGVAIAVALVPPLAVAGIGLGRMDLLFFSQAFLLFFTNLIGIVLAASFTFRFLGYSPVIQEKKGLAMVFGLMCLIMIPLWFSYDKIVSTHHFERGWTEERFLVNNKYIIVKTAKVITLRDKRIITMDLLVRDRLNRRDLSLLKEKIQRYYSGKIEIRANVVYIL